MMAQVNGADLKGREGEHEDVLDKAPRPEANFECPREPPRHGSTEARGAGGRGPYGPKRSRLECSIDKPWRSRETLVNAELQPVQVQYYVGVDPCKLAEPDEEAFAYSPP